MAVARVISIVGARPQFVKLAAVERALRQRQSEGFPITTSIVHTGQHYDDNMSKVFFDELGIPAPAVNLEVGSGSQAQQTARMLVAIERYLQEAAADVVIVYGDTNSTLAGTLAAVKLHIPVAHVEAGLRSFNRRMPEEVNRVLTDHAADLLLAPTDTAMTNLANEGLKARAKYSGDVMYDAVQHHATIARQRSNILDALTLNDSRPYALATIHRADNTEPPKLRELLDLLNEVAARRCSVLFPLHPRTRSVIVSSLPDWRAHPRLRVIDPLGYVDLLRVLQESEFVLTDSGGLQKEAAFLGRHCFTLREETEWVETVEVGLNCIVGSDRAKLFNGLDQFDMDRAATSGRVKRIAEMYGEGRAGAHVADAVMHLAHVS